jgi:hypothetical protein
MGGAVSYTRGTPVPFQRSVWVVPSPLASGRSTAGPFGGAVRARLCCLLTADRACRGSPLRTGTTTRKSQRVARYTALRIQNLLSCRAKWEQISLSRPDFGPSLSHFQCKKVLGCSLPARQRAVNCLSIWWCGEGAPLLSPDYDDFVYWF